MAVGRGARAGDGPVAAVVDAAVAPRLLEQEDVEGQQEVAVHNGLEGAVPVGALHGEELASRLHLGAGEAGSEGAGSDALG